MLKNAWFRAVFVFVCSFAMLACTKKAENTTFYTGNLTIWTVGEESEFINAVAKKYMAESQNKVKISVIEFPSEAFLHEELLSAMAESTGPDIISASGQWMYDNKGKIFFLNADQTLTPQKFKEDYAISAYESMVFDQKIYGIPLKVETLALFFNEDHIIESIQDRNTPATTWEDIKKDATSLQKVSYNGEVLNTGVAFGTQTGISHEGWLLTDLMVQNGTPLVSTDASRATFASGSVLDSSGRSRNPAVQAIDFYKTVANAQKSPKNIQKASISSDITALAEGKVSYAFGTATDYKNLKDIHNNSNKTVPFTSLRVAPLPKWEKGNQKPQTSRVSGLTVPRSVKTPALAWQFLKYIGGKDRQTSFTQQTELIPAHLQVLLQEQSTENTGVFARQAKTARFTPLPPVKNGFYSLLKEIIAENQTQTTAEILKEKETELTKNYSTKARIRKQTKSQTSQK